MAAHAVKYSAKSDAVIAIPGTTLNGLGASGACSDKGNEIDNATNRDRYMDVELVVTPSGAPASAGMIYLYLLSAPDGTNYETGDSTAEPPNTSMVGAFNGTLSSTQHRIVLKAIPIPPSKFKLLLRNNWTNFIGNNNNVVTIWTFNEEVQ